MRNSPNQNSTSTHKIQEKYEKVLIFRCRKKNSNNILEEYQAIYNQRKMIKVGVDVWRELEPFDFPSHPIQTYETQKAFFQEYDIIGDIQKTTIRRKLCIY